MGKKPCCDKNKVKRGQWSAEEDLRLKSYIEEHGIDCGWVALPERAGLKRCGKSCRLRWLNYLRPGLKHGNYTEIEEKIICKLYSMIGSRWSVIAAQLPGRTDNDIKNHWNTQLKHKWLRILHSSPIPQLQTSKMPSASTSTLPMDLPPVISPTIFSDHQSQTIFGDYRSQNNTSTSPSTNPTSTSSSISYEQSLEASNSSNILSPESSIAYPNMDIFDNLFDLDFYKVSPDTSDYSLGTLT